MAKKNLAWHFVGKELRDGRPIPKDGEWLEYRGGLVLCVSGLHWSREPFDALQYAPGDTLCLVEVGGEILEPEGENKGVSSRRKIIARMDATELLRYFARMQALSVIHLNEDLCNSEVICDYLMTGDESLRDAAWDAAWAAARAAARAAGAAGAAAKAAARAAARAAGAAGAAARDAAWDAAWAAGDAARAAAWDAARQHFNELVYESFEAWL
jgi:hypothetical protein